MIDKLPPDFMDRIDHIKNSIIEDRINRIISAVNRIESELMAANKPEPSCDIEKMFDGMIKYYDMEGKQIGRRMLELKQAVMTAIADKDDRIVELMDECNECYHRKKPIEPKQEKEMPRCFYIQCGFKYHQSSCEFWKDRQYCTNPKYQEPVRVGIIGNNLYLTGFKRQHESKCADSRMG